MKDAVSLRRVLMVLVVVLIAIAAYSAWLAWQTERDLRAADAAVARLQAAVDSGDDAARDAAVSDLRGAAASAAGRTNGPWWGALTRLPVYGDDAAGVEAVSASIDIVARDAITPLIETVDTLPDVIDGGSVDVDRIEALEAPVTGAAAAMRRATVMVEDMDSSGFVPAFRARYEDYVRNVVEVADNFEAARTAVRVLPGVLASEGPRDYLFIFQNNAEIRSTGGLPGSWARLHVEDGKVELREQGSADDLNTGKAVTDLSPEEMAVYDNLPALYFQDPGFIPDVPRAAELFEKFWNRKYPTTPLDGIISLDPVAMSYLLEGTGPVAMGDFVLDSDNLVAELLSGTYQRIPDPAQQDRQFQRLARVFLEQVTTDLVSPAKFVEGFARAVSERRVFYAPFVREEAALLAGNRILGALHRDAGDVPQVDVGVNDATGGKMSYYLRYNVSVASASCEGDTQQLEASMTLNQTISAAQARKLPDYVTANDDYGIPAGSQLVLLRIYGPLEGVISNVRIDGKSVEPEYGLAIDGRPVVTVGPLINSMDDVLVTWSMNTGAGQRGDGDVRVTPSIVPGSRDTQFESSCR